MAYNPNNPNGQATMANSAPVVIASDQTSVPVLATQADTNITGTISATDILAPAPAGGGVLVITAPTASSFVAALVPGGTAQADIQITGTATGTYYFEASMDSTTGSDGNWIATNYRQTGISNTVLGYSTTAVGVYRGAPSGFKYIRVRNVGGTTPNNPVIFRYSNGSGTTFLNASIPAGTNVIGKVGFDQTTPGTTNGVQVLSSALPTGAAQDGTDITTPTAMPAGGVGVRGWLSAIWTKLNGFLDISDRVGRLLGQVTNAGTFAVQSAATLQAGSAVAGKFGIDQTIDGTTNAVRLLAETTKVIGTVNISGAQTIAAVTAITNALPIGANTIGAVTNANLDVALSTRLKPADTLSGITTVAAVTAITNALPVGANVIGKISIDQTTPGTTNKVSIGTDGTVAINAALPAGTAIIGALSANQSVNTAQINGAAVSMGAGASGTGVQRVILATDNLPTAAAAADALANPTVSQLGADMMVFNGTSWDRQRGMSVATTTGDTGAKTATGNGASQTNVGNKGIQLFIVLGAVSGTTPTVVFKLQGSVDGGTNFYDIPGATTASLIASTNVGIMLYPGIVVTAGAMTTGTTAGANGVIPRTWRIVWTIGGTTPSFAITSITYNYISN